MIYYNNNYNNNYNTNRNNHNNINRLDAHPAPPGARGS